MGTHGSNGGKEPEAKRKGGWVKQRGKGSKKIRKPRGGGNHYQKKD